MPLKIAINGFGRIGRQFFRIACNDPNLDIVAINDLGDSDNLAYLLRYDSVYGRFEETVSVKDEFLVSGRQRARLLSQKDPALLPWEDLDIDVAVECTGFFTDRAGAQKHLTAGAKKVLISAPAKEPDLTVILGVNHEQYDSKNHHIISNASCTTNCAAPVIKILKDAFGVDFVWLSTAHAYTATQSLVDAPADRKDMRRGRSGAVNIVPSATGAAKAVVEVIPELKGKLDGIALRVPVACGSLVDLVVQVAHDVTVEEVNSAFGQAGAGSLKGILQLSNEPLVSTDVIKTSYSAIVDGQFTKVLGGKLVKVLAWYDNEWGYSCRLVDVCKMLNNIG